MRSARTPRGISKNITLWSFSKFRPFDTRLNCYSVPCPIFLETEDRIYKMAGYWVCYNFASVAILRGDLRVRSE